MKMGRCDRWSHQTHQSNTKDWARAQLASTPADLQAAASLGDGLTRLTAGRRLLIA